MKREARARRPVQIVVSLDPAMHALLIAACQHTGWSEAEVIVDGLRRLFVTLPRPEDGATT